MTTSRRRPRTVTVSPVTTTRSRCCLQASWPGSALSAPSTTSTCPWPGRVADLAPAGATTPSPAPGVLSGAHALWLLDGPDRVERQKRGLCLVDEEFFREHQAVRDIAGDPELRSSPRLDSHEGLPRRARGVDGPGAGGRRDDRHDLERGQDPKRHRVAGHGGSPPRRARSRERRADQCRPHRLAHLFRSRPRPALAGQVSHQVRGANPWQQARHGRARSRGGSPTASATWIWPPPASASS